MEIVLTASQPTRFRLSEDFLSPYRRKGDCFASLLARSTYLTKYCRGNAETWTETIQRVIEGNVSLTSGVHRDEAELLFHLFWTGQALPPGRGLWTGGVDGIPADARFNCFRGDTRFFADGDVVALGDVVGQTVEVLARDGKWRAAEVKSFGVQKLFTYRFKHPGRSKFVLEFTATQGHRWFTENRGEVTDLGVGDAVVVTPREVGRESNEFALGFQHGMVFADGARCATREGQFQLRLCGEKARLLTQLEASPYHHNTCRPPSFNGDPVVFLYPPSNWKALPEATASLDYQAGFLEGWLRLDGSVRGEGKAGSPRLSSQDGSAIDWAIERAPLLGYCVVGRCAETEDTNYGPRSGPLQTLSLRREPVAYQVFEVVDRGVEEEVFCVVEPETRSFTLAGGVVTGNCWYTTLTAPEEWCWTADRLMLGGGVGVGLCEIDSLPVVSETPARFALWCRNDHPDLEEVNPEGPAYLNGSTPTYRALDSREGWVEALRRVITAAYAGRDVVVDVSDVRQRGAAIRTFGGIACGPGPLAHLLRATWTIIRGAKGRRLTSVEALDITNHIGLCIKSGNVRRSALIALGSSSDQAFRDAKKDRAAVVSHRHTSNNSLCFRSWEEIDGFDWASLVEDNIEFGEPGILNLPLAWQTDPGARGVNPCGEQTLHDREACNLAEVFPAKFEADVDPALVFRLVTRYALRQRLTPLIDPVSHEVGQQNMRVGVGLGGLCDFDWTPAHLSAWFQACRTEADSYADQLGVNRPITVTTVKPSGTISLLNGSSPGIHAPHSEFYIRRTRIAKNDPMAGAMIEANVPHEEDIYDKSGHTWVFAFPMRAPHARVSKETETIRQQFERQAEIQRWWADNAVSATLNFDTNTEREELAECLKEFVPRLKSTSCLPKAHGYDQAPYEAIDEMSFHALHRSIQHDHPLVRTGDMETLQGLDECVGGVCPVR